MHRRLILQRKHLGADLVTGGACFFIRTDGGARIQLGVAFRNDLEDAATVHHRITLQAQRRQENVVDQRTRDRLGRDNVDAALHARVEQEIPAGDFSHRFDHALDVRIDEIKRNGFIGRGAGRRFCSSYDGRQAQREHAGGCRNGAHDAAHDGPGG